MESSPTPQQLAKTAHLRYVNDQMPGIVRQRQSANFIYKDHQGQPITDAQTLDRIKKLVIPPEWEKVWIRAIPTGHLQATGLDSKGRKQYRYHPKWREACQETKFDKLVTFGEVLPIIRQTVSGHLRDSQLSKQKVLAAIVGLLGETLIRVGNEEYAEENHSYGLTTMRHRHAKLKGNTAVFDFRGKSGVEHVITVNDPKLVRVIRACRDLPGYDLFQYLDESGERQVFHSGDVNEYLTTMTGQDITAKDFRTWGGTTLAVAELLVCEPCEAESALKKNVVETVKKVASHLGNRPATCRKYYIHPGILESYLAQTFLVEMDQLLHAAKAKARPKFSLTPTEHATWQFVKSLK
jgi:DNA topoisomerase-1